MSAIERAAKVLAEHEWSTPRGYAWTVCDCGQEFGDEWQARGHVVAELAAAGLLPDSETSTEWGVWLAEDDDLVRDGLMRAGTLLNLNREDSLPVRRGKKARRERTRYRDTVGDWQEVES